MEQERDTQEQRETGDATGQIRERLQRLQEKTSELNRTLEEVDDTLEQARGNLNR